MERKNLEREISIARQSQSKLALELCSIHGIKPTLRELMRLTDVLAESVLLTPDDEFKETIKKIDEWMASKKG
jgi:hypothetical protein